MPAFYSKRFASVVGAPRCGTTFISDCLRDHPDVCFSAVKEPHYFSQRNLAHLPLQELRETVSAEYIERYFGHMQDEPVLAEGSVSYLYDPPGVNVANRIWRNSKFIIMIRDPLAMLPSLHQRLICTGDETVLDFERAWGLVPERMQGRHVPRSCIDPRFLQYQETARLGTHVQRFFNHVGRERCMVVVFDDLQSRPDEIYREVLEFLELPPHVRADYTPKRESFGCKVPALQRLLKRPPKAARSILAGEKFRHRVKSLEPTARDPAPVDALMKWRRSLLDWNKAPAPEVHLSPAVRQQIIDAYTFEIEKLSFLLQRDLSHWLGGKSVRPRAAPPPGAVAGYQRTAPGPQSQQLR